jgi:hypothetical protein
MFLDASRKSHTWRNAIRRIAPGTGAAARYLAPALTAAEQAVAQIEGWILGVAGRAKE